MKRFVWRLQKVLDVRTKQEEIRRIELFRLTERLAEKQGELLMCQRVLREILDGIAGDKSPQRLVAQEFFLRRAAVNDERIRRLKGEIAELQAQQKDKTAELLALRRSREGLERLRAQAEEQFIREQEKLEQKELDDGSTMAFARKEIVTG
ncbi:MAG: flagellar FliJ family protein [Sedimentisphaerales bacterium]|nr:flagellar FliJ family protein [Sedimentisphaerales bacterium]